jgi:hypothetical protein
MLDPTIESQRVIDEDDHPKCRNVRRTLLCRCFASYRRLLGVTLRLAYIMSVVSTGRPASVGLQEVEGE